MFFLSHYQCNLTLKTKEISFKFQESYFKNRDYEQEKVLPGCDFVQGSETLGFRYLIPKTTIMIKTKKTMESAKSNCQYVDPETNYYSHEIFL